MARLQNTDELKKARDKLADIAWYYDDYRKMAAEGLAGLTASRGNQRLSTARTSDYVRAHKKEIWDYRKAFTEQYLTEHPEERDAGEPTAKDDKNGSGGSSDGSDGSSDDGNPPPPPGNGGENDKDDKDAPGGPPAGDVPPPAAKPSGGGDGGNPLGAAPGGDKATSGNDQADSDKKPVTEELIQRHAIYDNLMEFDLDRLFFSYTKSMMEDYFNIIGKAPRYTEDLSKLDRKEAQERDLWLMGESLNKAGPTVKARGNLEEDGLTDSQKNGLSEIAKYLYQNCGRRASRRNVTFVEGLLLRPARERLLICYLIEKERYEEATDEDVIGSQVYTPNLEAFKESIERKNYNLIGWMMLGKVHWSYLYKAAETALDLRDTLILMAQNDIFSVEGHTPEVLAAWESGTQPKVLTAPEDDEAAPAPLAAPPVQEDTAPKEIPAMDKPSADTDKASETEHKQEEQIQKEVQKQTEKDKDSSEKDSSAAPDAREKALQHALAVGRAYIATWKNFGSKVDTQLSEEQRGILESTAEKFNEALQALASADDAVIANNNGSVIPVEQQSAASAGGAGSIVSAAGRTASTTGSVAGTLGKVVPTTGGSSGGSIANLIAGNTGMSTASSKGSPFTMNFSKTAGGDLPNRDLAPAPTPVKPENHNGTSSAPLLDRTKYMSDELRDSFMKANEWGWNVNELFSKAKNGGTGIATTLGGIASLYTFATAIKEEWPTLFEGSFGENTEFITKQLDSLVSAAKSAMSDVGIWHKLFGSNVAAGVLENLATAVGWSGVVSGALGVVMGSMSIHTGRMDKKRLNTIADWTREKSEKAGNGEHLNEEASDESYEGHIIKVSAAAANRKANRDIDSGIFQLVSGALNMVGGILSMTGVASPLGAALIMLGSGVGMIPTLWGFYKAKDRRAELIDDYINMDRIMSKLRIGAVYSSIDDIKGYVRDEVAELLGFNGEKALFGYLCKKMANSLLSGLKKNMAKVKAEERKKIAKDAQDYVKSEDPNKKEFANYVLLIESFGPRFNFKDNGTFTRPTLAQLTKAVGST